MKSLTDSQKEYIARVKKAREAKNVKHEDVAREIGVARNTYTNYELERPMPQKYISKFCEYVECNEQWLISGKGQMNSKQSSNDEFIQKLYNNLEGFSEGALKDVEEFVTHLKKIEDAKARVKKK